MTIYHIAFPGDWATALEDGEYRISTRGRNLDEQGFIHASGAHQVATVANAFYRSDDDLIVLVIDPDRLTSPLRYDAVPDSDEPFPHIYGPLNTDAVIETRPLLRAGNGDYAFTP